MVDVVVQRWPWCSFGVVWSFLLVWLGFGGVCLVRSCDGALRVQALVVGTHVNARVGLAVPDCLEEGFGGEDVIYLSG